MIMNSVSNVLLKKSYMNIDLQVPETPQTRPARAPKDHTFFPTFYKFASIYMSESARGLMDKAFDF